jgi:hypothetical protein
MTIRSADIPNRDRRSIGLMNVGWLGLMGVISGMNEAGSWWPTPATWSTRPTCFMPFRGDSTRYEVYIAKKELIYAALSIYFSNYCCDQEYVTFEFD